MKKFRIKNYGIDEFIVQERWLLGWYTWGKSQLSPGETFKSIDEAKKEIEKTIDYRERLKKAKYTEYV